MGHPYGKLRTGRAEELTSFAGETARLARKARRGVEGMEKIADFRL